MKQINQVSSNGIQISQPGYSLNPTQEGYAENTRTADTIVAQAAAAPGDPAGSLELNYPLYVATQVAENTRDQVEDPRVSVTDMTRPTIPTATVDAYMDNANTQSGSGAYFMLGDMFSNVQNTPLGSSAIVRTEADRRLAEAKERRDKEAANTGALPTKECSGDPGDPYCDPAFMTDVTKNSGNDQTVNRAVVSGEEEIANSDTLDSSAGTAAETLSTTANTEQGGVAAYDTAPLISSGTAVNALIYELYDTIGNAYFDLTQDQTNWSQAALLMIYDEMKFNAATPQTQVPQADTNGATGEIPVTYY